MSGYEHQAIDHSASIRAERPDPDQVQITITHGENESSITIWAEDFETMAREALPGAQIAAQEPADPECSCAACDPGMVLDGWASRMSVCPDCGNKRCPKAANHAKWQCSGSNAVGQLGVRLRSTEREVGPIT